MKRKRNRKKSKKDSRDNQSEGGVGRRDASKRGKARSNNLAKHVKIDVRLGWARRGNIGRGGSTYQS